MEPAISGGPLLDAAGRVQATVFATTMSESPAGGYAVPDAASARRWARRGR